MNKPWRFSVFTLGTILLLAGCASSPNQSTTEGSSASTSDSFSPKFEYAGTWIADGDQANPVQGRRQGKHVVGSYNNGSYKHVFKGEYTSATTIVGIQTRWKRADQTTTRMRLNLLFLSPDSIRVDWITLDSNSDLAEGQTGVSYLKRTQLQ